MRSIHKYLYLSIAFIEKNFYSLVIKSTPGDIDIQYKNYSTPVPYFEDNYYAFGLIFRF